MANILKNFRRTYNGLCVGSLLCSIALLAYRTYDYHRAIDFILSKVIERDSTASGLMTNGGYALNGKTGMLTMLKLLTITVKPRSLT